MPATDRSIDAVAFITDHARDFLRRRLREVAGLSLLTVALLGAIALATWSVQDPSLSHATQKPIHNLLGYPGAIFSDLAMQLLGLAAVLLLAPEALLGWRLLSHRPLGEKWRGLVWIAATWLAAGFISTLPRIGSWPLPTGLGGVCGDALLRLPGLIFGWPLGGLALLASGLVLFIATALAFMLASGWHWPRFRAAGERSGRGRRRGGRRGRGRRGARSRQSLARLRRACAAELEGAHRAPVPPRAAQRSARRRAGPGQAAWSRASKASAGGPHLVPEQFDDEDEEFDDDEDEEAAPAPRRRAAAPKAPARRAGSGFALPSLNLLSGGQGLRPHHRVEGSPRRQCRRRWKPCCRTSACAARSSMPARARW